MIIVIDFDGTCVTNDYPEIGKSIGAEEVLRQLVYGGHKLILLTMRTGLKREHGIARDEEYDVITIHKNDRNTAPLPGYHLSEAVEWFERNGIPLFGINENPEQSWSSSRKVFGHLYIDDANLGIPLVWGDHKKPYVDWVEVRRILEKRDMIGNFKS